MLLQDLHAEADCRKYLSDRHGLHGDRSVLAHGEFDRRKARRGPQGGWQGKCPHLLPCPLKTDEYNIIATSTNPGMGKFTLTVKELKNVGKPRIELKNDRGNADYAGT